MEAKKDNLTIKRMYESSDRSFYFNVSPAIVPSNKTTEIILKYDFESLQLEGDFEAVFIPYNDYVYVPFYSDYKADIVRVTAANGEIALKYSFGKEQMYIVEVYEIYMGEKLLLHKFAIYALDKDLYNLKALKGDLHSHTNNSDGFDTPELIVGAARKCGLDFLAVTDHNSYYGSMKVDEANTLPITILPGEEFSSNFTPMHIISLGADKPIDKKYYIINNSDFPDLKNANCDGQIGRIAHEAEKVTYECTRRLVDKIHEADGIAIMCHAFWKPVKYDFRMDAPEKMVLNLLTHCGFDAYEVVSGSPLSSEIATDMQMSFLKEVRLGYDDIACLGVTDSHMYSVDPLCGNHYTIVFAEDNTEESIVEAIRKKRTVAVARINGKIDKCYGKLRYVKYAHFLIKYVFPQRDRKAYLEGLNYQESRRKQKSVI